MTPDPDLPGLETLPETDQSEIGMTLGALLGGFGRRDATLLESVYAEDADWVNAFGTVKKGSADIVAYLRGLFADANFDAGQMAGAPASALRRVSDTVVIVSTRMRIAGQGLTDGGAIALRDNHSLRVLQRQPGGRWLIVSEIYMDARQDQTYAAQG